MIKRLRMLAVKVSLVVMGLAAPAYAQSTQRGPQFCPPFEQFLSPTFLDFIFPGFSTRT